MNAHQKKLMQFIHDTAAAEGARCPDTGLPSSGCNDALQKIHDLALGSGASCALYRDLKTRMADYRPGRRYAVNADMLPAFKDYMPGNLASMAAGSTPAPTAEDAAFAESLDAAVAAGSMTREHADALAEARDLAERYAQHRNQTSSGQFGPSGV